MADQILEFITQKKSAKTSFAITILGIIFILVEDSLKVKLDDSYRFSIYAVFCFSAILTVVNLCKKFYDVSKKPLSRFVKKRKLKNILNNLTENEMVILVEFYKKGEDILHFDRSNRDVQSLVHKGIISSTGFYSGSIVFEKTHSSYLIKPAFKSIISEIIF